MNTVRDDFKVRTKEIDVYFRFVDSLEQKTVTLVPDRTKGGRNMRQSNSDTLMKTLKANCFLLLYNLVESTMRNAISAIFEELQTKGVSYDDCREEVRRIALRNLKRTLEKKDLRRVCTKLTTVSQHILTETFEQNKLFSGNIDARVIREVAADYGFSEPSKRLRSDQLLTVKTQRNDLAHGVKSFTEVGREYSSGDLIKIKEQVKHYLAAVLDSVEDYIVNARYLATPRTPVITPSTPATIMPSVAAPSSSATA